MSNILTIEERLEMLRDSLIKNKGDTIFTTGPSQENSVYKHAFNMAINSLYSYFPELKPKEEKS